MAISFSLAEKCYHSSANSIAKVPRPLSDDNLKLKRRFYVASQETFCRRRTVICTGVSLATVLTFNYGFTPLPLQAAEKDQQGQEDDADKGIFDSLKSFFDPNEKTKSGKILPRAYVKSAREVVKTLRESLEEDGKDIAKFRRTADAAKESIREYLNGWKGQQSVVAELLCSAYFPWVQWNPLVLLSDGVENLLKEIVMVVVRLPMLPATHGLHNRYFYSSAELVSHVYNGLVAHLQESYVALEKAIRSLANFYSKAGPFATLPEEVKSSILDQLNTADAFL